MSLGSPCMGRPSGKLIPSVRQKYLDFPKNLEIVKNDAYDNIFWVCPPIFEPKFFSS